MGRELDANRVADEQSQAALERRFELGALHFEQWKKARRRAMELLQADRDPLIQVLEQGLPPRGLSDGDEEGAAPAESALVDLFSSSSCTLTSESEWSGDQVLPCAALPSESNPLDRGSFPSTSP